MALTPTPEENTPNPMTRRILAGCALSIVALLLLVTGFVGGYFAGFQSADLLGLAPVNTSQGGTPEEVEAEFAPFWETWTYLQQLYIDQPLDNNLLVEGAINGLLESLDDPNTSYMTPAQMAISSEDFGGELEGIGVEVDISGEYLRVISPMRGSPAEEAGVLPNDLIVAVNGIDVFGMDPYDVIAMVRGPAGTTVEITILREGEAEELVFEITRYRIVIPQAEGYMLDNGVGVVQINSFGDNTADELRETLSTLLAEDAVGLIVDLRNNPGGDLNSAIAVASQFVAHSPLMIEEFGDGSTQEFRHQSGGLATEIPMVVLVNAGSASASEVVAMAIRDYDRALIVGETTFGKGTIQAWRPLRSNGGAVRITIARWLSPNGTWVHDEGIVPDVEVALTPEDFEAGEDPQLDAAVATLLEQIRVAAP